MAMVAGVGAVAACVPVAPVPPQAAAEPSVEQGTITIRTTVNANFFLEPDAFDEAKVWTVHVPEFNIANPDVKIIVEPVSRAEYTPKVLLMAQTGDIPDVLWSAGAPISLWSTSEVLQPLDDLIADDSEFDLGLYQEAAISTLRYDVETATPFSGSLWGLGQLLNPGRSTLYWNASVFEEAGVDLPGENATYDDLVAIAQQLTQDTNSDGNTDVWGFMYNVGNGHGIGADSGSIVPFGGEVVSRDGKNAVINSPEAVAAWQWYYDLLWSLQVTPPADVVSALGDYKEMHMKSQLAMYRNGPWGGMHFRQIPPEGEEGHVEAGGMPVPKGPSGRSGAFLGVEYWGIAKATKYPQEAWEVLKWITDQESCVLRSLGTLLPPLRTDAMEDERVQGDPLIAMNVRAAQNAETPYYAANGRDSEVNQLLGQELAGIDSGDQQPTQEFFDGLAEKVQAILDMPPA
jgi:ABC-type glycerol-3-phosphate transport system substrate-binding protein